jgi:hypothetical protein
MIYHARGMHANDRTTDTFFNEQLSNYVQFSVAFRQDILTDILLIPECDCNIVTFGLLMQLCVYHVIQIVVVLFN